MVKHLPHRHTIGHQSCHGRYACLNMDLREQKPPVFTNRDCIKKTWTEKGVAYISELALENARALPGIIQWNHEHGIRFFRRARMRVIWRPLIAALPSLVSLSEYWVCVPSRAHHLPDIVVT